MKKPKEDLHPSHPLGTIPIKIGRAFMQRTKHNPNSFNTVLQLGMASGTGRDTESGMQISYSAGPDGSLMIMLWMEGDSDELRCQQRYTIDIRDVIRALLELNAKRRADGFSDAPPLEAA